MESLRLGLPERIGRRPGILTQRNVEPALMHHRAPKEIRHAFR